MNSDPLAPARGIANALLIMGGFVVIGLAIAGHPDPFVWSALVVSGFLLGRRREPKVTVLDAQRVIALQRQAQKKRARRQSHRGVREWTGTSDGPMRPPAGDF